MDVGRKMIMKNLFIILCCVLLVEYSVAHRWRKKPKPSSAKRILEGLRNLPCRWRHMKVVLDGSNRRRACVSSCPVGHQESYSLHWGHHCKKVEIPEGCTNRLCFRCKLGYYWIFRYTSSMRCVSSCPEGYYEENNSRTCIQCSMNGCAKCSGMWRCEKCKKNMLLVEYGGIFGLASNRCEWTCPWNKVRVTVDDVEKCVKEEVTEKPQTTTEDYTDAPPTEAHTTEAPITEAHTTEVPPTKAPTTERATTQNNEKTTVMETSLPTTTNLPTTTVAATTTPSPTTTEISTAPPTTVVLSSGCADRSCTVCVSGWKKFSALGHRISVCLQNCPPGYGSFEDICIACSDRRCSRCSSSITACDKCFAGFHQIAHQLNGSSKSIIECVRNCPKTHKKVSHNGTTFCKTSVGTECPIANCKKCTRQDLHSFHVGCAECKSGFALFRGAFRDQCNTNCPASFFRNVKPGTKIVACEKCGTPFCRRCSDAQTCEECLMPFTIDRKSGSCGLCPAGQTFDFKKKKCISTITKMVGAYGFCLVSPSFISFNLDKKTQTIFSNSSSHEFFFSALHPDGALLVAYGSKYDYELVYVHNGQIYYVMNAGSGSLRINTKTKYNDGKWHKVNTNRMLKVGYLYVDDVLVSTGTAPGSATSISNVTELRYGGSSEGSKAKLPKNTECLKGSMANFKLFDENLGKPDLTVGTHDVYTIKGIHIGSEGGHVIPKAKGMITTPGPATPKKKIDRGKEEDYLEIS